MKAIQKTIVNDEAYLRQISVPVILEDDYAQEIEALREFCRQTKCFALAAVQIGIPKRMVYLKNTTLDISQDDMAYDEAKVLLNPVILDRRGHTKYWEACVSCLDNVGLVSRPYEMTVQYYGLDGVHHEEKFSGFAATVLSHELDHLDGILHMDLAEQLLNMPADERKIFRTKHPYEVISKTCAYDTSRYSRLLK